MAVKQTVSKVLGRLGRMQEIGVIVALVALCLILGFSTENFFGVDNFIAIIRSSTYMAIMALGMVFVLSARDVDLSVGGIYMLSGMMTALMLEKQLPILAAVLIGIMVGIACGLINFSLSVVFRIPTIIITLGTLSIYRGLGLVISSARPIYRFSTESWFVQVLGKNLFWKLPTGIIVLLVLTVILAFIYSSHVFGTRVRGIGSNPEAARFSGIPINRYRALVFTLMGSMCAIASALEVSFLEAANPAMGSGMELMVIASAIIGGTSLSGGKGSIVGAIIGALIISVIRNGIVQLGVSVYWASTVTGFVIIAAVAVDYLFKRRRIA